MAQINLKYRRDIDGLRAVAVLAVILFHAFPKHVTGGFVGVDVFFVISGFLISKIIFENLHQGTFSFLDFYSRRIRRIFPALSLVLVSCFALGYFLELLPEQFALLGKHIASGAGFVSNLTLWGESGYFDSSAELKPLLHLWSLGIEEQFYFFWPLLLWAASKRKNLILPAVLLIFAGSFALNLYQTPINTIAAFYSPLTRFWELLTGALLAYSERKNIRFKNLSLIGFALIAFAVVTFKDNSLFPGWRALFPTVGAFLIIASGEKSRLNQLLLSNRFMVGIGLISYPLYLWHWPLLSFLRIWSEQPPSVALRMAAVLLSVLLSILTFKFVEKRLRHGSALTLLLFMVLIGSVGITTYLFKGIPSRFPAALRPFIVPFDFQFNLHSRADECNGKNNLIRSEKCFENKRPLLFLWGDSHAMALYPGLQSLKKYYSFGIAQATSSGTPPLLGYSFEKSPHCAEDNMTSLRIAKQLQPEIILLHGSWTNFEWPYSHDEFEKLFTFTIKKIKSELPHSRIIVVGPVPQWPKTLQKSLYSYYKSNSELFSLPTYMNTGLDRTIEKLDSRMNHLSEKLKVEYISAYKIFCQQEGCLIRVGPEIKDLVTFDYGHLGLSSSIYFSDHIQNKLFLKH